MHPQSQPRASAQGSAEEDPLTPARTLKHSVNHHLQWGKDSQQRRRSALDFERRFAVSLGPVGRGLGLSRARREGIYRCLLALPLLKYVRLVHAVLRPRLAGFPPKARKSKGTAAERFSG